MMALIPQSIPSPDWSSFNLGPLTIHAYALCIMLGMVAAIMLTRKRWRDRGLDPDIVLDAALLAIPMGIVGARLYHVAITDPTYYFGSWEGLREIPMLWHGGLGIMGAVAFGALAVWIVCRRNSVSFATFADCVAPSLLVAQAIGRWGNWFNQELFGGPTTLPWGLEISPQSGNFLAGMPVDTLFHPTFLYESLWNLLGAAVLIWLGRSARTEGRVDGGRLFAVYLIWYGLGRMLIELFLRIDPSYTLMGVRIHVFTAAGLILLGLVLFWILSRRSRCRTDDGTAAASSSVDPTTAHDGTEAATLRTDAVEEPTTAPDTDPATDRTR
ncbi:prolipoprotein diacylglyceryl transferase [Kocuria soli]|uniref:Phosphatidylglycerol--prolipoprotein diacylglyceryl transferase n=2 Tax=Kocuria soli TaxID=2485125 RepID=A0A3N3ZT40_9MICC|nr:prolipoprotein diacylglyceryl transferase [Kocuria soli]